MGMKAMEMKAVEMKGGEEEEKEEEEEEEAQCVKENKDPSWKGLGKTESARTLCSPEWSPTRIPTLIGSKLSPAT